MTALKGRSAALRELKSSLRLDDEQREVLVGLLLGDAHLESRDYGRTYRLKIEQCYAHRIYVDHLFLLFKDWVLAPPKEKTARNGKHLSKNYWFQTVSHAAFRFYAAQFYDGRRKKLPRLLGKLLTPRGLAYWYMDDGSIKSRQSRAVLLNTQSFTKEEVREVCETLETKFGLMAKPRRQKDGEQVYISGRSFQDFTEITCPYILQSMRYKVPQARQTYLPKM